MSSNASQGSAPESTGEGDARTPRATELFRPGDDVPRAGHVICVVHGDAEDDVVTGATFEACLNRTVDDPEQCSWQYVEARTVTESEPMDEAGGEDDGPVDETDDVMEYGGRNEDDESA